ncbi:RING finger domain-containing protein [Naegleria gruberi]|uniref:RBR-type E3 ubiquitin transferase n=1 Tax=Naegleria gruberi TaxID=5762 RepID=D2UXH7_NAEGR|nr:RING finger domain-containing protein [Naegleria gruberi]EFC50288.1 RING finger domain-containing protein [Naegleria gruberi]|eukprot:XP_002683032.1 RING finger domain-containing protein [Naegleria gruberi strain NEG-M]
MGNNNTSSSTVNANNNTISVGSSNYQNYNVQSKFHPQQQLQLYCEFIPGDEVRVKRPLISNNNINLPISNPTLNPQQATNIYPSFESYDSVLPTPSQTYINSNTIQTSKKNPQLKIGTTKTRIVDDFVMVDPGSPALNPPTTTSINNNVTLSDPSNIRYDISFQPSSYQTPQSVHHESFYSSSNSFNNSNPNQNSGYYGQPGGTPITGKEHPQYVMPPPPTGDIYQFPQNQTFSQMSYFYPQLFSAEFYSSNHIVKTVNVKTVPTATFGQYTSVVEITLEDDPYKLIFYSNELEQIFNEKHHQRRVEYRIIERYVQMCRQTQTYLSTSNCTIPIIDPIPTVLDLYTEHIKKGTAVVRLDLVGIGLGDEDAKAVAWTLLPPWSIGSSVRRLNLSGNKLTSKGAQYVSNAFMSPSTQYLKNFNNTGSFSVKELDLSFNREIGLAGAQHLANMLSKNTSLTYVNFAQTGITAVGCDLIISALIQNTNSSVIKLDLRHDLIGEDQIAKLCTLVEKRNCLCFLEIYPYKEISMNDSLEDDNDGWLSYDGWVKHSLLRELLEKNMDYMKNHPKKLQKKASLSINKTPTASPSTTDTNVEILSSFINSMFSTTTKVNEEPSVTNKEIDDTELSFDNDIFSLSVSDPLKNDRVVNYLKLAGDEHNHMPMDDGSSVITCSICYEDNRPTDGTVFFMEDCEHRFCCTCIYDYVKDKIQKGEVDSIKCPECDRQLTVVEVKQILSQGRVNKISQSHYSQAEDENLFSKFEEFSLKRALGGMKDLVWCPNPKCGNAIIVESPNINSDLPTSPLPLSPSTLFPKENASYQSALLSLFLGFML